VISLNSVLAIILIILGVLFYTVEIDFLSLNTGKIKLDFFQEIIRSDFIFYGLLGMFLIIHLVLIILKKKRI